MTAETLPRRRSGLQPYIWVQPTGFGPNVYAGQIVDGDGDPAPCPVIRGNESQFMPVRLQPLTVAGRQSLDAMLVVDLEAAVLS